MALSDKELLELCVRISGAFENGSGASYTTLSGNFDGNGMSAGILNWTAGQGTLQQLVQKIVVVRGSDGWTWAQTFFKSDIHHFSVLNPQEAKIWCLDHYIQNGNTNVDPAAAACWTNFLGQPESIAAQIDLASTGPLARAKTLSTKYCPQYPDSTRVAAFFFDLVTQSGGMQNSRGAVEPVPVGQDVDYNSIIDFAHTHDLKCAGIWQIAVQNDPKAQLLLWYGYQRALLSNPQYVWDACARRGSIACRSGFVHGATVNFTGSLD